MHVYFVLTKTVKAPHKTHSNVFISLLIYPPLPISSPFGLLMRKKERNCVLPYFPFPCMSSFSVKVDVRGVIWVRKEITGFFNCLCFFVHSCFFFVFKTSLVQSESTISLGHRPLADSAVDLTGLPGITLSLPDVPGIVEPPAFCLYGALWALYINGWPGSTLWTGTLWVSSWDRHSSTVPSDFTYKAQIQR